MLLALSSLYPDPHKVHTYLEYHSVCPLVGIGTPSVPPPPDTGGGGSTYSPAREGVRGVPIRTTGEKAAYSVYSVLTPTWCKCHHYWGDAFHGAQAVVAGTMTICPQPMCPRRGSWILRYVPWSGRRIPVSSVPSLMIIILYLRFST